MSNTEIRLHCSSHNYTCHLGLFLLLGLLVSAGCGKSDGKEASDNNSIHPPVVKKLSPEAARMELAKLGKDYSPEEFVKSAANGDKMAIKLFVAAGMDVNVKMFDGRTALLLASMDGRDELVQYLLDLGADPNVESRDEGNALSDGWTPLIFAAFQGHTNVVKQLIAKGSNIEAKTQEGVTALIEAIRHGQPEGVRILLEHGASVSTKIGKGFTPLMLAASGESPDVQIVKLILAKQPDLEAKTDDGATAMDCATDPTVRELLRSTGARPITDLAFAGIWKDMSATKRDIIAIKLHAGLGRRPGDRPDQDALKFVRDFFSNETIKSERDQGYSNSQIAQLLLLVDDTIKLATIAAFQFEDNQPSAEQQRLMNQYVKQAEDCWAQFEAVYLEALKKGEVSVDFFRWHGTPVLSWAVTKGRIDFVDALLKRGADVNLKDDHGLTALDYAKQNKQEEIEQILLNETLKQAFLPSVWSGDIEKVKACLTGKVDANTRDTNSLTALMYASAGGNAQIAQLLIQSGAAVDAKDPDGGTAIMRAKNAEVAKVLLDNGANPNSKTTNGVSPLLCASEYERADVVSLLLEKGAAPDVMDSDGWTALNSVAVRDNVEIIRRLLTKGARIDLANNQGRTALMFAAGLGRTNSARLLLEKGADRKLKDVNGQTATEYAQRHGHPGIVKMLTESQPNAQ